MSKKVPPRRSLGARPCRVPDLSKSRDRIEPPLSMPSSSQHTFRSSSSSSHSRGLGLSSRLDSHHNFHRDRFPPDDEKSLGIPHINSTRSQEKLIEKAIHDISKLPEKIEQAVSRKSVEPEFQKTLTQKAAKKLNLPKSGRIYHDLLDIETVAPIAVKRTPSFEPKPVDPNPCVMDYNKTEYTRIPPPQIFPLPLSSKKDSRPHLTDLDLNFNPNDLLRYERIYSSL